MTGAQVYLDPFLMMFLHVCLPQVHCHDTVFSLTYHRNACDCSSMMLVVIQCTLSPAAGTYSVWVCTTVIVLLFTAALRCMSVFKYVKGKVEKKTF